MTRLEETATIQNQRLIIAALLERLGGPIEVTKKELEATQGCDLVQQTTVDGGVRLGLRDKVDKGEQFKQRFEHGLGSGADALISR